MSEEGTPARLFVLVFRSKLLASRAEGGRTSASNLLSYERPAMRAIGGHVFNLASP